MPTFHLFSSYRIFSWIFSRVNRVKSYRGQTGLGLTLASPRYLCRLRCFSSQLMRLTRNIKLVFPQVFPQVFPICLSLTTSSAPTDMGKLSHMSRLVHPSTWELKPETSTFAPSSSWSNKDMDPVPPHLRTWTTLNYVAYWISDATNPTTWEFASSMLAIGLSWYDQCSFPRSMADVELAGGRHCQL